jgi:hypothetical protein
LQRGSALSHQGQSALSPRERAIDPVLPPLSS